ncbi:MAG: hypothetical protein NTV30_10265 [Chloroflexi bacterium]|nr:hypothetical protein [Chloroflexota bacterium]
MIKKIFVCVLLVLAIFMISSGALIQCRSHSYEPKNNISLEELESNSDYWNTFTDMTDVKFENQLRPLRLINKNYHIYVENEYDCNDMAVDFWNMLQKLEINSIIVIGNLEKKNENFADCNHAWLIILNKTSADGKPAIYAIETTEGRVYNYTDVSKVQYFEGFFYSKPSDLRADLANRW